MPVASLQGGLLEMEWTSKDRLFLGLPKGSLEENPSKLRLGCCVVQMCLEPQEYQRPMSRLNEKWL